MHALVVEPEEDIPASKKSARRVGAAHNLNVLTAGVSGKLLSNDQIQKLTEDTYEKAFEWAVLSGDTQSSAFDSNRWDSKTVISSTLQSPSGASY